MILVLGYPLFDDDDNNNAYISIPCSILRTGVYCNDTEDFFTSQINNRRTYHGLRYIIYLLDLEPGTISHPS
jgi:Tol biopolymer transport system component